MITCKAAQQAGFSVNAGTVEPLDEGADASKLNIVTGDGAADSLAWSADYIDSYL